MRCVFLMDPMESVKVYKDTTYFLMVAAETLGHRIYHMLPQDLHVRGGRVLGSVTHLTVHDNGTPPFREIERDSVPLDEMDLIMIRPDPPFDRRYLYLTLILDLLPPKVVVVNRPQGLRDWNEKLAALKFTDLGPRTLVSADPNAILEFISQVGGRITLKPVDGFGGRGIFFLGPDDPNRDQIVNLMTGKGRRFMIAQEYLEAARDGDKRILLLNGEPLGAILRLHPPEKEINNLDAGGTALQVEMTDRDREICRRLRPHLLANGLVFVGIDVIGDRLVEINVTSPTGLRELADFSEQALHLRVMQALEDLVKAARR